MKNRKILFLAVAMLYCVLFVPSSYAESILESIPCEGECIHYSLCVGDKQRAENFDPNKTACNTTSGQVCCVSAAKPITGIAVKCLASPDNSCSEQCDLSTENIVSGNFSDCNKKCCRKKITSTPVKVNDCTSRGGQCSTNGCNASQTAEESTECEGKDVSSICCLADSSVSDKNSTQEQVDKKNGVADGSVAGNACPAGMICFDPPVSARTLPQLVGNIMDGLRSVIVMISIVFIVIGGIMYMSSAGSEKMIEKAKAIIGGAIIGLAITLAAPTFLKEILAILGNASGGDPNEVVSRALTVGQIAEKVLRFLLSISGILAMIGLVVGGFFYFTSYGDEDRIDKGKEIISASLIGIVVTLAAVLLVKQIISLMM